MLTTDRRYTNMLKVKLTEQATLQGYPGAEYRYHTDEGRQSACVIRDNWYAADAVDTDGNKYYVIWSIRPGYDVETDADESSACDWDHPDEIIRASDHRPVDAVIADNLDDPCDTCKVMIIDCVLHSLQGRIYHSLRIAVETDQMSITAPTRLPYNDGTKDALIGMIGTADEWVIGAFAAGLIMHDGGAYDMRMLLICFDRINIIADRTINRKHLSAIADRLK